MNDPAPPTDPVESDFPFKELLGLEVEHGDGAAVAWVDVGDRHMNPNAVAHGAVPFALMDTAMGAAVMSVADDGKICATIEMHTRFHRGARGGRLRAEATVLTKGSRVVHLEARTTDETGRLVATATSSYAVIDG